MDQKPEKENGPYKWENRKVDKDGLINLMDSTYTRYTPLSTAA